METDEDQKKWIIVGISVIAVLLLIVIVLIAALVKRGNSNKNKDVAEDTSITTETTETTEAVETTETVTTEAVTTEAVTESTEVYSVKDMVTDVISDIRGQSGFKSDGYWEPLAVCNDFNGDGVQELLAVYEIQKSDVEYDVMYELWSFPAAGAVLLKSEVLFVEVGGNSGVIGIVQAEGTRYLAIERYEPEAENFNNYYIYWPWNTKESTLGEENVYMESHGNFESMDQGNYILGAAKVDSSAFEARQADFSNWLYKINILEGAGNGDVMTFDALLSTLR